MTRSHSRLNWILAPIGLIVVAIAGSWLVAGAKGEAVHPNPQAISSVTQTGPPPQWSAPVDRIRRTIRDRVAAQNLPGLSVAVGVGRDIVWSEGFGWADIEARVPVTPDTRFRIETASAALTSSAVGVLLEKGRLKLDDEIQTYVPQFPKKQWPVTLRHLMADAGGVGTDGGSEGLLVRQRCEQPVQALPHFAQGALLFKPGTQYRHSKYGWILVSAAIEAAADQPFLAFMREQIFQPLGMANTGAESAEKENPERIGEPEEDPPIATFIREVFLQPLGMGGKRVRPAGIPATVYLRGLGSGLHRRLGFGPIAGHGLHEMRARNLSCYAGSMAFFSTPTDLVRFGMAMNGGSRLQPATVRLLQTPQQLASGQSTGHGLGWDIQTVTLAGESRQTAGYDGELPEGRVVSLVTFREIGIVVAVASNIPYSDLPALALKIAEEFAQPTRQGTNR